MTQYKARPSYAFITHIYDFTDICGGDPEYFIQKLCWIYDVIVKFKVVDDTDYFSVATYFEEKVIPHKIAVYQAGVELMEKPWFDEYGIDKEQFLENLWEHDMSKFCTNEAFGYAGYDFKNPHPKSKLAFEAAWHHHKMHNPHHPEYWLNPDKAGNLVPIKMPNIYVMEMIADWIGAGKTYGNTLEAWLPDNLHRFMFGQSQETVKSILTHMGFQVEEDSFRYSLRIKSPEAV